MSSYKQFYFLTLMPSGSVHIKPDGIASESTIKILQTGDKSLSISSRPSDHPSPTQQELPIQTDSVARDAGSWSERATASLFSPTPFPTEDEA
jgi:hypothetical protein